jgi:cytochrome c-type biogenesis protein CcmH
MAVVVVGALAYGTVDEGAARTTEGRARSIAASLRCPTCRSQSVLESDSTQSKAIRTDIVRRIQAGQTDDEITAFYVSRFGTEIRLNPERDGVAGLVWVLPVAAFVLAVAGVAYAFWRWRVGFGSAGGGGPSDDDRVLVEQARRRWRRA